MSRVRVLVGTRKGAFILSAEGKRDRWELNGPFFAGLDTFHVKGSPVNPNRVYATPYDARTGQQFHRSDNGGVTWEQLGGATARIRHVEPSLTDAEIVYAIDDENAFFRSANGGKSWDELDGIRHHSGEPSFEHDSGEISPHQLLLHPAITERMYAAISNGGALRSDDGGVTWQQMLDGCVHSLAMHPLNAKRIYAQTHNGVLKSDDGGDTWAAIDGNLPSNFGVAIETHASDPDTLYVIPMKSDAEHWPVDAKLRLYRGRAAGTRWEPLTTGLPQRDAYVNVGRNALAVDKLEPAGVYFGTSGGAVYASNDAGDSWTPIAPFLPAVNSIEVQTLA